MNIMEKEDEDLFQKRLEQVLIEVGYSQSELARALGVTPQCVNRWLRGISFPRPAVLKKLSEIVNKPVSWFYTPNIQLGDGGLNFLKEEEVEENLVNMQLSREEELLITLLRELPNEECRKLIISICMKVNRIDTR